MLWSALEPSRGRGLWQLGGVLSCLFLGSVTALEKGKQQLRAVVVVALEQGMRARQPQGCVLLRLRTSTK